MRSYIFDTNLISAVINNQEQVVTKMKTVIDKGEKLYLSVITDYEIRRGLFATQATRKLKVYEMLRNLNYYGLTVWNCPRKLPKFTLI